MTDQTLSKQFKLLLAFECFAVNGCLLSLWDRMILTKFDNGIIKKPYDCNM